MADWLEEVRHALRGFRQRPGFTAAAVVMLALGIGATTPMFSVVNGVLINPLPYPDSDALVRIVHRLAAATCRTSPTRSISPMRTTARRCRTSASGCRETTATITGQGDPEEVRTLTASRSLLTTLGVQPEIGRWFSKADDSPGAADTVMLTHGYWHRKFGGDRGVLDADAHDQRAPPPDHRRDARGRSASAESST